MPTSGGPPSIPVVFFKLQLILFFEDLRSERQLIQVVADRLSLRWFVGYDLTESLPDHSSLTRIRERYGLEVFRRFFETIVEQCIRAGLVWGRELYFDATKVQANASLDSVGPRFAVEAHLSTIFAPAKGRYPVMPMRDRIGRAPHSCRSPSPPKRGPRWLTRRRTAPTGSARPDARTGL